MAISFRQPKADDGGRWNLDNDRQVRDGGQPPVVRSNMDFSEAGRTMKGILCFLVRAVLTLERFLGKQYN